MNGDDCADVDICEDCEEAPAEVLCQYCDHNLCWFCADAHEHAQDEHGCDGEGGA